MLTEEELIAHKWEKIGDGLYGFSHFFTIKKIKVGISDKKGKEIEVFVLKFTLKDKMGKTFSNETYYFDFESCTFEFLKEAMIKMAQNSNFTELDKILIENS